MATLYRHLFLGRLLALVLVALAATVATVVADTVITTNSGYWGSASVWSPGVPGAGDDVFIASGHTVTMTNLYPIAVNSLSVSGLLTHAANTTNYRHRVNLQIAGGLDVPAGGRIDVMGMGYEAIYGPGAPIGGNRRCGASHGGKGAWGQSGTVAGNTYDSIIAPTNIGSGGTYATGGNRSGGGAILLDVGGAASVNGLIRANGTNSFGIANGGGSGGSVWLTAASLGGSGTIEANGGPAVNDSGSCGAGGGGRVSVVLTGSSDFDLVTLRALGGTNATVALSGAAGTVYKRTQDQGPNEGTLIVDTVNDGNGKTEISSLVTDAAVGDVIIRNKATLQINTNQTLLVNGSFSNGYAFASQTGATLQFGGISTATIYGGLTTANLVCTNAGKTLLFQAGRTNTVNEALTLVGDASSNLVVRSTVDGSHWYLSVKGAAVQFVDHADVRDSNARIGYSNVVSATHSTDLGNNVFWIFAAADQVDTWIGALDTVWSHGGNWDQGRAPLPTDSAVVISNGCAHYPALDWDRELPRFEMLSGSSLALNGYDLVVTGDATIGGTLAAGGTETVTFRRGVDFTGGAFVPAQSTVVIGGSTTQSVVSAGQAFFNLTVTNAAAVVTFADGVSAAHYRNQSASVNYDGDFSAGDFRVYSAGLSVTQTFAVGTTCSMEELYLMGDAGATQHLRAAGSGNWALNAAGVVYVKNVVVADSDASGGRTIHARDSQDAGGNPNWVFDAPWKVWTGAAGTAFTNDANWAPGGAPTAASFVLIDAPAAAQLNTPVTVHRLVLGGSTQATLVANGLLTVQEDLQVLGGGVLTHGANTTAETYKLGVAVASNLVVATGGRIDAEGKGYQSASGPGAPILAVGDTQYKRSGGGHGGRGGQGSDNIPGGTYGSIVAPTNLGSGGSELSVSPGGGAVRLTVAGRTRLEGLITANGANQSVNANAGGAGGSVYLTTGSLLGSGTIRANGAPGYAAGGSCGSGGGGRVAVVLAGADDFGMVTLQALGGLTGGFPGAAGTIYKRTQGQGPTEGTLVVANGGVAGTHNTEISSRVTDAAVGSVILQGSSSLQLNTNRSLTVYGSFSNGSAFVSQPGSTLAFAGTTPATIYGTQVIARLVCTNGAKVLSFEAGRTNTVLELLALQGYETNVLVLRSSVDDTPWYLSVPESAVQSVSFVDVKDSRADVGYATAVTAVQSTDSGNNVNWLFAGAGAVDTWIGGVDTSWATPGNWDLGRPPIEGDLTVVISNGCAFYPVLAVAQTVPQFTLLPGSSLALNGRNLTVTGAAAIGGTLTATGTESIVFLGNVDFAGGGFIPAQSTVVIGGTMGQFVVSAGAQFHGITVSNTSAEVVFEDAVTAVLFRSPAATVRFKGAVTAGDFQADGFGGTPTLTFAIGSTCAVSNLYLLGSAGSTQVLQGAGAGTWSLNVSGVAYVRNVQVSGSDASSGKTVYAIDSTDGGGNPNWVFDAPWKLWTGAVGASFTNDANWSPTGAPTADSFVLIDTTNVSILGTTASVHRLVLGGSTNATLRANAPLTVGEQVQVLAGGLLTHNTNTTTEAYKLNVSVAGDLTVALGGRISGDALGFQSDAGPGSGMDYASGGSHGGQGGHGRDAGQTSGATYGSVVAPTNIGSGGAVFGSVSGNGGGAIRLVVGNLVRIEGTVSAAGRSTSWAWSGGGSGGSIWITAATLAGSGTVSANGGNATYGTFEVSGGGGGRIAVRLTGTDAFGGVAFQSRGGLGTAYDGAAGTVYLEGASDTPGQGALIVDNNGVATTAGEATDLNGTGAANLTLRSLSLRNGALLGIGADDVLTLSSALLGGDATLGQPSVRLSGGRLNVPAVFAYSNLAIIVDATGCVFNAATSLTVGAAGALEINVPHALTGVVTLASGATLRHKDNSTTEAYKLDLAVVGDLTVATGAAINVDGKGYGSGYGPGTSVDYRSGGSYGGKGAAGSQGTPTNTYGSTLAPTNCGSGGGGISYGANDGGGAVLLRVTGTTTLDGLITADGTNASSVQGNSGGSGGTVYLTTATLTGSGSIHANGGAANSLNGASGAGGGGRVSVNLTGSESFGSVTLKARGGLNGASSGGAGSVYRATASQAGGKGTVTIDNNGMAINGYAELPGQLSAGLSNELYRATLVVTNTNTRLVLTKSATVGDVLIYTNASLVTGGSVLYVRSYEHPLDNPGTRGPGGTNRVDRYSNIVWIPARGVIFSVQ